MSKRFKFEKTGHIAVIRQGVWQGVLWFYGELLSPAGEVMGVADSDSSITRLLQRLEGYCE